MARTLRAPGGGRKMFLTSPYIDQAITLKIPRLSLTECNDFSLIEPYEAVIDGVEQSSSQSFPQD